MENEGGQSGHDPVLGQGDYRRLINELQAVIQDTLTLLDAFENSGMNERMVADYDQLHGILNTAIADQRRYHAELMTLLRRDAK